MNLCVQIQRLMHTHVWTYAHPLAHTEVKIQENNLDLKCHYSVILALPGQPLPDTHDQTFRRVSRVSPNQPPPVCEFNFCMGWILLWGSGGFPHGKRNLPFPVFPFQLGSNTICSFSKVSGKAQWVILGLGSYKRKNPTYQLTHRGSTPMEK